MISDTPSGRLYKAMVPTKLAASVMGFTMDQYAPGIVMFGATLQPGSDQAKSLDTLTAAVESVASQPFTQEELDRAREQVKSSLVMGLESANSRMLKMGNSMLVMGRSLTADELLERYDSVTREEILALAQSHLNPKQLSLSAIGKVEPAEEYVKVLGL